MVWKKEDARAVWHSVMVALCHGGTLSWWIELNRVEQAWCMTPTQEQRQLLCRKATLCLLTEQVMGSCPSAQ